MISPQKLQYGQQHPPHFYHNTTTPRVVTQSDLNDSQAVVLLDMLQATSDTRPSSSPLLHQPNYNQISTLPSHGLDVSRDLWDLLSNSSSDNLSFSLFNDYTASAALTQSNKICKNATQLLLLPYPNSLR